VQGVVLPRHRAVHVTPTVAKSAADGYTSEHRRLWSAQGLLLVDNVQTIVVGS
jgi:hypothetical protein